LRPWSENHFLQILKGSVVHIQTVIQLELSPIRKKTLKRRDKYWKIDQGGAHKVVTITTVLQKNFEKVYPTG